MKLENVEFEEGIHYSVNNVEGLIMELQSKIVASKVAGNVPYLRQTIGTVIRRSDDGNGMLSLILKQGTREFKVMVRKNVNDFSIMLVISIFSLKTLIYSSPNK